jgi:hypothetical protein
MLSFKREVLGVRDQILIGIADEHSEQIRWRVRPHGLDRIDA